MLYSMTTTKTSKAQQARDEKAAAIQTLRELFPSGSKVSCVVRHVTSSGMSRAISVLHYDVPRGEIVDISYLVARATHFNLDPKHPGLKVQGCGMDMVFHLVYSLAAVLYDGEEGGYALKHHVV